LLFDEAHCNEITLQSKTIFYYLPLAIFCWLLVTVQQIDELSVNRSVIQSQAIGSPVRYDFLEASKDKNAAGREKILMKFWDREKILFKTFLFFVDVY
jgi:hypothetical protein